MPRKATKTHNKWLQIQYDGFLRWLQCYTQNKSLIFRWHTCIFLFSSHFFPWKMHFYSVLQTQMFITMSKVSNYAMIKKKNRVYCIVKHYPNLYVCCEIGQNFYVWIKSSHIIHLFTFLIDTIYTNKHAYNLGRVY